MPRPWGRSGLSQDRIVIIKNNLDDPDYVNHAIDTIAGRFADQADQFFHMLDRLDKLPVPGGCQTRKEAYEAFWQGFNERINTKFFVDRIKPLQ